MTLWLKRLTRFSLGSLLLAFSAVAVWLGWQTYHANRQRAAVAVIQAAGGVVTFESDQTRPPSATAETELSVADQIQLVIGRDYFQSVTSVDLARNNSRRQVMKTSQAGPEVIAKLATLPDLKVLELGNNRTIDDEQLVHLSQLKKLNTVYLYRTSVRGPGLAHLAQLPQLTSISLADTPIEDDALVCLGNMPQLTWLWLDRTQISDAALGHLAGLTRLSTLSLSYTNVSDAGLNKLEKLSTLRELNLAHTKVTAGGLLQIQQALPNCRVFGTFGLGVTPNDVVWFPDNREPSPAELNSRFVALIINGTAISKPSAPNGVITELKLTGITLSDRSVIDLVQRLPMLEELNIRQALVGDELVKGLAGLDRLTFLSLFETRVTDEGLAHLARLPNLRGLYLTDTKITDKGLTHLHKLKNLNQIILENIRVSDEAIRLLQQELPASSIHR